MLSIDSVKGHPIFHQISPQDITRLGKLLSFTEHTYTKEEYIMIEGDTVQQVGIIIHGTVLMEKNDLSGNNYFVTELREHEIFAEPFMGAAVLPSSVNYKAMTGCYILFFDYQNIWKSGSAGDAALMLFTRNLMNLLAVKTRTLLSKIELLSKKSLRDRILTFLYMVHEQQVPISGPSDPFAEASYGQCDPLAVPSHEQSDSCADTRHGQSDSFSNRSYEQHSNRKNISLRTAAQVNFSVFIPFNKTEMAEYLSVNRSALVRELSRMKTDQILDYEKNTFYIFR